MNVSVVITCYNKGRYVADAINSVINQTIRPYEIIVIDDYSDDDSKSVIMKFGDNIKLFSKDENTGVLDSTLIGIELCKGDIVSFLDADDIWCSDKIEKIISEFNDHNCIFVTHTHEYIDNEYQISNVKDATHKNIDNILKLYPNDNINISQEIKNSLFNFKGVWLGSAYSIRRSSFSVLQFREILKESLFNFKINDFYQDHPIAIYLALKYIDKIFIFKIINKPLFKYRIHNDNFSGSVKSLNKALAVLRRHDATMYLIRNIAIKLDESSKLFNSTTKELKSTEHLWIMYEENPFSALLKLFENSKYFDFKYLCKEIIRCLICLILGKNFYFKIK